MESKQEGRSSGGQTDGFAGQVRNFPSLRSELCGPVASGVGSHAATVTANTTAGGDLHYLALLLPLHLQPPELPQYEAMLSDHGY